MENNRIVNDNKQASGLQVFFKRIKNLCLYRAVTKCIKNKFKFLFDMGFSIKHINKLSQEDIKSLQIVIANNTVYREFEIIFYIDRKDFIFTIYNTNDKDNCSYNFFSLTTYIATKNTPYDIKLIMDLENYNGTDEERINQLLDYVCNILQKDLIPILSGKEWAELDYWLGTK